jgi:hypothetical protein
MTLRVHPELVQGTPEWLAARCGLVTASVVAKLLTPTLKVADNDTSRGIVATLVTERLMGLSSDEVPVSSDMWRGIHSEPYARAAYAEHHAPVAEVGFMSRDDWGFAIGYSPDGLVGEDGLVEIKCPRAKNHLVTVIRDEVPAAHMAQLQTGLLVSGRSWIDFVSFFGGMPLYRKRVEPDPAWHEAILAAVTAFEAQAEELRAAWCEKSEGLPATDPIPDLEVLV